MVQILEHPPSYASHRCPILFNARSLLLAALVIP